MKYRLDINNPTMTDCYIYDPEDNEGYPVGQAIFQGMTHSNYVNIIVSNYPDGKEKFNLYFSPATSSSFEVHEVSENEIQSNTI